MASIYDKSKAKAVAESLEDEETVEFASAPIDPYAAILEQLKQLKADNERLKAAMWERAKPDEIQSIPIDPQDLKLCTVLYGYGKVGATNRVWVGGAGGTTWEFIGGVCKNVPWSVAKHWKSNTRPDGSPVLGILACHVLPNEATTADYAKEVGFSPKSVSETAAMIAAADLEKLADALPKATRDLLIQRLQSAK